MTLAKFVFAKSFFTTDVPAIAIITKLTMMFPAVIMAMSFFSAILFRTGVSRTEIAFAVSRYRGKFQGKTGRLDSRALVK